jgi:RNA polymerase sigma factor (sigma-70 family)
MTIENSELLRRYVADRSEPAFTSLVERHINLVYSAALRQVGGNVPAAEDVTQAVFCDLARHARRLTRHPSLTGWLYTSTRFQAAKARRTEQRRRAREQEAHAMNHLLAGENSDPAWLELRPVLDDAMHDLNAADRDAVLMRYFEEKPMAEIGARFGITENAARMRVDRAVEKLRAALAKRGVSSTAAVLIAGLTQYAVGAAPEGLATQASQAALAMGAGVGGLLGGVQAFLAAGKVPLGVGSVAAAVLVAGLWLGSENLAPELEVFSADTEHVVAGMEQVPASSTTTAPGSSGDGEFAVATAETGLQLEIVTADTGQPVPNARIEYWRWEGTASTRLNLTANRFGHCLVPLPRETTTQLILVSQSNGFADTRLAWRPDRGEVIPQRYTLRVARSVPIGGMVVDADGEPVAGAEVSVGNAVEPASETRPQSDSFDWPFYVATETDAEGRWRIDRIGKTAIRTMSVAARHPDHIRSASVRDKPDSAAVRRLLEETYVFQLGRAVTARGVVVDADNHPVSGAQVTVGRIGFSGSRETVTGWDGTFEIAGCEPGRAFLSAEAPGFAPATIEANLADDAGPFRLTLTSGQLLRMRVVNTHGVPVPNAMVWLDTVNDRWVAGADGRQEPRVQAQFNRRTDIEGRLEWDNAPDQELVFHISAAGFMRNNDVILRADGTEHEIVLDPALTISGTVTDEQSGEPIPRFRIITGYPVSGAASGTTGTTWSGIDRFWMSFEGGQFHHLFTEPVVRGRKEPSYVFKFEAEGYAPVVTRIVRADEGEARFDVRMRSATGVTVTVLLPDGQPAISADVGLVSPGARLRLVPGGFTRGDVGSAGMLLVTDEHGRFDLPPDPAILRVVASHPEGLAESTPELLLGDPVLRLELWGRLQGTYLSGGKGAADRELWLRYRDGDLEAINSGHAEFRVNTDENGAFLFPQAPPGRHKLVRLLMEPEFMGRIAWTHSPLIDVDILPGETTTVVIGASDYTVTARLEWPDGPSNKSDWRVHGVVLTPMPPLPPEVAKDPTALTAWRETPVVKAALANFRSFPMTATADGTVSAEDVPPGDYLMRVSATARTEPGGASAPDAQVELMISVPDDPPTGILDLGVIQLRREP